MFDAMWPIGSVYISVNARSAPFQNIPNCRSTWVQLSTGRTLWNVETTDQLGATVECGLPNIVGKLDSYSVGAYEEPLGAFRGIYSGDVLPGLYDYSSDGAGLGCSAWGSGNHAIENCYVTVGSDKKPVCCKGVHVKTVTTLSGARHEVYDGIDAMVSFDASRCSEAYGRSTGVQPASIKTTMWKRIA